MKIIPLMTDTPTREEEDVTTIGGRDLSRMTAAPATQKIKLRELSSSVEVQQMKLKKRVRAVTNTGVEALIVTTDDAVAQRLLSSSAEEKPGTTLARRDLGRERSVVEVTLRPRTRTRRTRQEAHVGLGRARFRRLTATAEMKIIVSVADRLRAHLTAETALRPMITNVTVGTAMIVTTEEGLLEEKVDLTTLALATLRATIKVADKITANLVAKDTSSLRCVAHWSVISSS